MQSNGIEDVIDGNGLPGWLKRLLHGRFILGVALLLALLAVVGTLGYRNMPMVVRGTVQTKDEFGEGTAARGVLKIVQDNGKLAQVDLPYPKLLATRGVFVGDRIKLRIWRNEVEVEVTIQNGSPQASSERSTPANANSGNPTKRAVEHLYLNPTSPASPFRVNPAPSSSSTGFRGR